MFSEAVFNLLPDYRTRDATAKDSLDVYIEILETMQKRAENDGIVGQGGIAGVQGPGPKQNCLPEELRRRL